MLESYSSVPDATPSQPLGSGLPWSTVIYDDAGFDFAALRRCISSEVIVTSISIESRAFVVHGTIESSPYSAPIDLSICSLWVDAPTPVVCIGLPDMRPFLTLAMQTTSSSISIPRTPRPAVLRYTAPSLADAVAIYSAAQLLKRHFDLPPRRPFERGMDVTALDVAVVSVSCPPSDPSRSKVHPPNPTAAVTEALGEWSAAVASGETSAAALAANGGSPATPAWPPVLAVAVTASEPLTHPAIVAAFLTWRSANCRTPFTTKGAPLASAAGAASVTAGRTASGRVLPTAPVGSSSAHAVPDGAAPAYEVVAVVGTWQQLEGTAAAPAGAACALIVACTPDHLPMVAVDAVWRSAPRAPAACAAVVRVCGSACGLIATNFTPHCVAAASGAMSAAAAAAFASVAVGRDGGGGGGGADAAGGVDVDAAVPRMVEDRAACAQRAIVDTLAAICGRGGDVYISAAGGVTALDRRVHESGQASVGGGGRMLNAAGRGVGVGSTKRQSPASGGVGGCGSGRWVVHSAALRGGAAGGAGDGRGADDGSTAALRRAAGATSSETSPPWDDSGVWGACGSPGAVVWCGDVGHESILTHAEAAAAVARGDLGFVRMCDQLHAVMQRRSVLATYEDVTVSVAPPRAAVGFPVGFPARILLHASTATHALLDRIAPHHRVPTRQTTVDPQAGHLQIDGQQRDGLGGSAGEGVHPPAIVLLGAGRPARRRPTGTGAGRGSAAVSAILDTVRAAAAAAAAAAGYNDAPSAAAAIGSHPYQAEGHNGGGGGGGDGLFEGATLALAGPVAVAAHVIVPVVLAPVPSRSLRAAQHVVSTAASHAAASSSPTGSTVARYADPAAAHRAAYPPTLLPPSFGAHAIRAAQLGGRPGWAMAGWASGLPSLAGAAPRAKVVLTQCRVVVFEASTFGMGAVIDLRASHDAAGARHGGIAATRTRRNDAVSVSCIQVTASDLYIDIVGGPVASRGPPTATCGAPPTLPHATISATPFSTAAAAARATGSAHTVASVAWPPRAAATPHAAPAGDPLVLARFATGPDAAAAGAAVGRLAGVHSSAADLPSSVFTQAAANAVDAAVAAVQSVALLKGWDPTAFDAPAAAPGEPSAYAPVTDHVSDASGTGPDTDGDCSDDAGVGGCLEVRLAGAAEAPLGPCQDDPAVLESAAVRVRVCMRASPATLAAAAASAVDALSAARIIPDAVTAAAALAAVGSQAAVSGRDAAQVAARIVTAQQATAPESLFGAPGGYVAEMPSVAQLVHALAGAHGHAGGALHDHASTWAAAQSAPALPRGGYAATVADRYVPTPTPPAPVGPLGSFSPFAATAAVGGAVSAAARGGPSARPHEPVPRLVPLHDVTPSPYVRGGAGARGAKLLQVTILHAGSFGAHAAAGPFSAAVAVAVDSGGGARGAITATRCGCAAPSYGESFVFPLQAAAPNQPRWNEGSGDGIGGSLFGTTSAAAEYVSPTVRLALVAAAAPWRDIASSAKLAPATVAAGGAAVSGVVRSLPRLLSAAPTLSIPPLASLMRRPQTIVVPITATAPAGGAAFAGVWHGDTAAEDLMLTDPLAGAAADGHARTAASVAVRLAVVDESALAPSGPAQLIVAVLSVQCRNVAPPHASCGPAGTVGRVPMVSVTSGLDRSDGGRLRGTYGGYPGYSTGQRDYAPHGTPDVPPRAAVRLRWQGAECTLHCATADDAAPRDATGGATVAYHPAYMTTQTTAGCVAVPSVATFELGVGNPLEAAAVGRLEVTVAAGDDDDVDTRHLRSATGAALGATISDVATTLSTVGSGSLSAGEVMTSLPATGRVVEVPIASVSGVAGVVRLWVGALPPPTAAMAVCGKTTSLHPLAPHPQLLRGLMTAADACGVDGPSADAFAVAGALGATHTAWGVTRHGPNGKPPEALWATGVGSAFHAGVAAGRHGGGGANGGPLAELRDVVVTIVAARGVATRAHYRVATAVAVPQAFVAGETGDGAAGVGVGPTWRETKVSQWTATVAAPVNVVDCPTALLVPVGWGAAGAAGAPGRVVLLQSLVEELGPDGEWVAVAAAQCEVPIATLMAGVQVERVLIAESVGNRGDLAQLGVRGLEGGVELVLKVRASGGSPARSGEAMAWVAASGGLPLAKLIDGDLCNVRVPLYSPQLALVGFLLAKASVLWE